MIGIRKLPLLILITLLCGCGGDDEPGAENNGRRTFKEAEAQYLELRENFSLPLTRTAGFPTSGVEIYKGMHTGEFFERNTTADFEMDYFADVEFTLDFEAQTFTGELTNFTTNLKGFENPEGVLSVSGSIRTPVDLGGDEFGLRFRVNAGDLTQEGRTASFDSFTANKGRFLGETGGSVNISITSLFTWTEGQDAGTASETKGFMHADTQ